MTALAPRLSPKADPIQVLIARAEARAILYREGEYTLHEAVDGLQAAAVQTGLVEVFGQDRVQAIIAAAFVTVRVETDVDVVPDLVGDFEQDECAPAHTIPKSTIDAAEYLARLGKAGRLRKWLALHSAQERTAIRKHLEGN